MPEEHSPSPHPHKHTSPAVSAPVAPAHSTHPAAGAAGAVAEAQNTAAHPHKQPVAHIAVAAAGRKDAACTARAQARHQWGPIRRAGRTGLRRLVLEAEGRMDRMRGKAWRVRRWGRIGSELGGRRMVGGGTVGKREIEVGRKAVRLRRRRGSGVESGVVVRRRWVPEQGQRLARRSGVLGVAG
jgi:hypothetical protein